MKYKIMYLLCIVLTLTMNCAVTNVTSIQNPDMLDVSYSKIMIVAPFTDIAFRKTTEDAFVSRIKYVRSMYKRSCEGVASIEIIPPIKEYSNSDLEAKVENAEVDAILVIALEDYWTSEHYVPKSEKTTAELKDYGYSLSYESYTQQSGGYYVSKPRVKFDIRLYDVESGEIVWMASTVTSGNAFANYETLMASLSQSVVEDLRAKGLLKK